MSTDILSDEFQAVLLAQWPYEVNEDFCSYTRRVTELVAKRIGKDIADEIETIAQQAHKRSIEIGMTEEEARERAKAWVAERVKGYSIENNIRAAACHDLMAGYLQAWRDIVGEK